MLNKLKKVSLKDVFGALFFLIALIPAVFYKAYLKIAKKELWLICEREDMARDNGFAFFEYMQKNHPEIKSYYAISKKTADFGFLKPYEKSVVQWSSISHYFLYIAATKNISSHKNGNPNQTLFTVLHLYLNLFNNRVFLQHGILKEDAPMFYYRKTKFKVFICGAKPEYDYISRHYGYPEGIVKYTGLARYDKLSNDDTDNSIIAFIPTWRRWLNDENIEESEYKKNILSFLNDKKLEKSLAKNKQTLLFYPHSRSQRFFEANEIKNPRVKLCKQENISLNELIRKAGMLITDYSSLFFDFAYLRKPMVYYQPDGISMAEGFRKGYFDYGRDGFGPVIEKKEELIDLLASRKDIRVSSEHYERFFEYNDQQNCARIFTEICNA